MQPEQKDAKTISIHVIREPAHVPMTPRKRNICWSFGIPPREEPLVIADDLQIRMHPGGIVLLSGPSGSGKSTILRVIAERAGEVIWVGAAKFYRDRAIVDAIAPRKPLATALEILTACGLGEPRLWVRRFDDLSDGEKFRARLARAVGTCVDRPQHPVVLCDEFTAVLHRRMAKAVAYNLRKLVSRHGLKLVVATTHDDILEDLQPDQVVRLGDGPARIIEADARDKPMSLRRHATIEEGSVRDYATFGPMHYRHRDGLGFVDKVFLLRESPRGAPIGILVFAHAPMELALRNRSTEGRFVRNVRRLNRELRILRRLVMHPDVRGCGLGHWFVRNTLPRVGVRFIECLAAMGAINPVFEKAGMRRIGRCALPQGRMQLLQRLRRLGIDPFAPDFPTRIGRYPRVRRFVEEAIQEWADRTQSAARYRIGGKPPQALARTFRQIIGDPPMYYLWDRQGEFPRRERSDGLVGHSAAAKAKSQPLAESSGTADDARFVAPTNESNRHRPEKSADKRPAAGEVRPRRDRHRY